MPDLDDLLQNKIIELENGASLEDVLKSLPDERGEVKDLLQLVAAVRAVPHPEPLAERVIAQRRELLAAAVRDTVPVAARRGAPQPVLEQRRRSFWNRLLTPGVALAAAGVFAVLLLAAAAVLGLWAINRGQDVARVEAVTGQVQVAANQDASEWQNLAAGDTLRRGDRVRTLGASSATLVFYEDTRIFISPHSDLAFSELNGLGGQRIQVRIDQKAGETSNRVTPLTGKDSYFLVDTPSGTASVHGTNFSVKVSQSGQAQFLVKTGEVRVRNDSTEVTLKAGQATAADPGGAIADPTFQFNTQGSLLAVDQTTGVWNVSGVEFFVLEATVINGSPQFGDTVRVTGRILAGNVRVADAIELASDSSQTASFTGTLEQMGGPDGVWIISGQPVNVSAQTALDAGLATGDPVRVTFNIIDDAWAAVRIETLAQETEEPIPTPTATADPRAKPSYEFNPDELEASNCGSRDFNLTGTLSNTSDDAKDYAANVQLGYEIERGGDAITMVELTPGGWTRIDAGQTVTFNIHVTLAEKWLEEQNAEVKLRIYVVSATNRPNHLNGRLTVTLNTDCAQEPEAPAGTPAPENNEAPSPTQPAVPEVLPGETGLCTGANPHPTGVTLSQRYGVPYEEIMSWFCQHYGFGEIDLAYSLSRQSQKPVAEIFAMRASGMGWGDIQKLLAGDQEEGGKPEKKDSDHGQEQDDDDGDKKDKPDKDGKPGNKKP